MYDELGPDGKRVHPVQQIATEFGVARPTMLSICAFRLRRDLAARMDGDDELNRLLAEVVDRRLGPASAATQILKHFEV